MINEKLTKQLVDTQNNLNEADWRAMAGSAALITALLTGTPAVQSAEAAGLSHQQYSHQDYINAIVGEAENQGYDGMLAIAGALRNRAKQPYYRNNVLHGVYGKDSPRLSKVSQELFDLANKAWEESKRRDITGGAYIWGTGGDVAKFREQSWFKNVKQTVEIRDHYFFKNK